MLSRSNRVDLLCLCLGIDELLFRNRRMRNGVQPGYASYGHLVRVRRLAQPLVSLYRPISPKGSKVQSLVNLRRNQLQLIPLPDRPTRSSSLTVAYCELDTSFTPRQSHRLLHHSCQRPIRVARITTKELCQFKLDRPVPINPPALEVHHTTQCLAK